MSKESISKDLEAMKKAGMAGFHLFDLGLGFPEGPVEFNSEQYHEHIAYTIAEAERLGLEMGYHNASDWSCTGGPWIKPDQSMKMLIWSETEVEGGLPQSITLKRPEFNRAEEAIRNWEKYD